MSTVPALESNEEELVLQPIREPVCKREPSRKRESAYKRASYLEQTYPAPRENSVPPQDGGTLGWIQCAAGFCVFFNTWGLLNTFGAFQAYYHLDLLKTSSNSSISWIGTVQSSLILLGAMYSGPLYNKGYLRLLMVVGSFCLVLGMFMTSLCTEFWQFMLAQGLLMGLGLGCLFLPTIGVIAAWFRQRAGLAMGIASSGSAIGGIIYPIVFYRLVNVIGFGWTVRVLAFMMLTLSILPILGMKDRPKLQAGQPQTGGVPGWTPKDLLKEADYILLIFALFLGYMGLYIPYFYVQIYCVEKQIITGDLNFYLTAIINAGGFIGRLAIGGLADKVGPMNAFILDSSACTAPILSWTVITSQSGIIAFCCLYGFCSAGLITLPATILAVSMCPDISQYAIRMTVATIPNAFGLLIGNPIAGNVLDSGWDALQIFSGISVLACTLLAIASRTVKVGFSIQRKL